MKTFLAVALFLGLAASAQAKDIAQYSFNHTDASGAREIDTLTLSDDGVATIARVTLGRFLDASLPVDGEGVLPTVTAKLSKEVFNKLKFEIGTLATAEIVTTRQQVVCMMMPMPGASRSLLVNRGGELTVVQTQVGCWAVTHVAPKDAFNKETAKSLISALEVLGLTYVDGK